MEIMVSLLINHAPELAAMLVLYILLSKDYNRLDKKVAVLAQEVRDALYGRVKGA